MVEKKSKREKEERERERRDVDCKGVGLLMVIFGSLLNYRWCYDMEIKIKLLLFKVFFIVIYNEKG